MVNASVLKHSYFETVVDENIYIKRFNIQKLLYVTLYDSISLIIRNTLALIEAVIYCITCARCTRLAAMMTEHWGM